MLKKGLRRGSAWTAGMMGSSSSASKKNDEGSELRPILEGPLLAMEFVKDGKEVKWTLRHVQIFADARVLIYSKKGDSKILRSETLTGDHFVADARFENGWQISDFETILYFASQNQQEKTFWMHAVAGVIRRLMEPMDALPPQYAQVAMHRHSVKLNQGPAFDTSTVAAVNEEEEEQKRLEIRLDKETAQNAQIGTERASVRLNKEMIDSAIQDEIKASPPPPPPPRALHLPLSGTTETPTFVPPPSTTDSTTVHSMNLNAIEIERDEALAMAAREKSTAQGLARELETARNARDAALNELESVRSQAERSLQTETQRAENAQAVETRLNTECERLREELTQIKSKLKSIESSQSAARENSEATLLEKIKLLQDAQLKAKNAEQRTIETEQRESSLQDQVANLKNKLAQAEDEARRANTALVTEQTARRSAEDRLQSIGGTKEDLKKQLDEQAEKWLKALKLERDRTQTANDKLKVSQAQLAKCETELESTKTAERRAIQQAEAFRLAASQATENSESVLKRQVIDLERSLETAKREIADSESKYTNSIQENTKIIKKNEDTIKQLRAQLTSAQSKSGLADAARVAETKRANEALAKVAHLETQFNAVNAELESLKQTRARRSLPRIPVPIAEEEASVTSTTSISIIKPAEKSSSPIESKEKAPPAPVVTKQNPAPPPPSTKAADLVPTSNNAIDSVSTAAKLWDTRAQQIETEQKTNTFSKFYDPNATKQLPPKDGEYGTPPPGSATAARWEKGKKWVDEQIDNLIQAIHDIGETDDNCTIVTFGALFYYYADVSDSLVGILMRAKKRQRLFYEGDMLFQNKDDHVIITCPLVATA
uniref:Costars domain-containing protein n=1 Tax=Aureoumbra lagunensis TaxID=44058 RepID=A0A7S3NLY4_9STRA|mmetsp:Transcript_21514/g.32989  ORF Transcript_21514/g.32989 Transcript_21514/m.32989 type:complete len:838 (-) Transcript_21514:1865-4378(-)